jgi:hypothetical protein
VLRRIFGLKRDEVKGNGEDYIKRNLMTVLITKYYSGNQIEKNEMGAACRTYGAEMWIQDFGGGT